MRFGAVAGVLMAMGYCQAGYAQAQEQPQPSRAPARASWLAVEIGVVRVSPTHPGTTMAWDGPAPAKGDDGCGFLTGLGAAVPHVGIILSVACGAASHTSQVQQQRNPALPDLFVWLSTRQGKYATYVATDSVSKDFQYHILVPMADFPQDGLRFVVADADGDGQPPEEIGYIQVTKDQIKDSLKDHTALMLKDEAGGVLQFEVKFQEVGDPKRVMQPVAVNVQAPLMKIPTVIVVGQVAFFRARGSYSVSPGGFGSNLGGLLTPAGFTDGRGRNYTLKQPGFETAALGAALVQITDGKRAFNVPVGDCIGVVSPFTGVVLAGVNDREPANNGGTLTIESVVYNPKPADWVRPGGLVNCPASMTGAR